MRIEIDLIDFLRWTGGEYRVTGSGNREGTHRFSFPNYSATVSAPGQDAEDALREALEFVCSQVSYPPDKAAA